jgi:mono/diheme cytochrome c family protein
MSVPSLKTTLLLIAFTSTTGAFAQDSEQVTQGKAIYTQFCTLCHGADGKRGEGFQSPIWGEGSFIATKFGNANTMIEYMQTMPFNDPTLINDTQRLAVVAYLLAQHGAIPKNGEITPQNAASVAIK